LVQRPSEPFNIQHHLHIHMCVNPLSQVPNHDFGGFFQRDLSGAVSSNNPFTNASNCPPGYSQTHVHALTPENIALDGELVFCRRL
jgi:hypothetical protein